MRFQCFAVVALLIVALSFSARADTSELLHVSYDPTRELFDEINKAFIAEWKKSGNKEIEIRQSHGGSGKQARSVIDGLEADIVSLALSYDIDEISSRAGLLPSTWQSRLPNNSCPYTSTVVFLVRKGNPRGIHNWDDLVKPGIAVITPNPKTSGGARWNYLAAWGFAQRKFGGDEKQVLSFMQALFKNVPILDTGARGATTTFVQRGIGDVLVTWENEAYLALEEFGHDSVEMITPPLSIRAEPPVALLDKVVDEKGTRIVAERYLQFLYSPEVQEIIARRHFRPQLDEIRNLHRDQFVELELFSIDENFGGWRQAQAKHFSEGGTFDQIYLMKR